MSLNFLRSRPKQRMELQDPWTVSNKKLMLTVKKRNRATRNWPLAHQKCATASPAPPSHVNNKECFRLTEIRTSEFHNSKKVINLPHNLILYIHLTICYNLPICWVHIESKHRSTALKGSWPIMSSVPLKMVSLQMNFLNSTSTSKHGTCSI